MKSTNDNNNICCHLSGLKEENLTFNNTLFMLCDEPLILYYAVRSWKAILSNLKAQVK